MGEGTFLSNEILLAGVLVTIDTEVILGDDFVEAVTSVDFVVTEDFTTADVTVVAAIDGAEEGVGISTRKVSSF